MGIFESIAHGLNDLLYEPQITNGVEGTAQVVSASDTDGRSLYRNCHMELVVEAPGIPATATSVDSIVHRNHWPRAGNVLPVMIERDNPKEVVVLWDKVPDTTIQAMNDAERIAAARNAGSPAYPVGTTVKVIGEVSQIPESAKSALRAAGIDIDKLIADGDFSVT